MARSIREHAELLTVLILKTSSPLGKDRGEGKQSWQCPLTLALSREGRGEQKALHAEKQTPIK